jgi:hypothetical protein
MLFIRANELTQIIWSNTLGIDKEINFKYYYSSYLIINNLADLDQFHGFYVYLIFGAWIWILGGLSWHDVSKWFKQINFIKYK